MKFAFAFGTAVTLLRRHRVQHFLDLLTGTRCSVLIIVGNYKKKLLWGSVLWFLYLGIIMHFPRLPRIISFILLIKNAHSRSENLRSYLYFVWYSEKKNRHTSSDSHCGRSSWSRSRTSSGARRCDFIRELSLYYEILRTNNGSAHSQPISGLLVLLLDIDYQLFAMWAVSRSYELNQPRKVLLNRPVCLVSALTGVVQLLVSTDILELIPPLWLISLLFSSIRKQERN